MIRFVFLMLFTCSVAFAQENRSVYGNYEFKAGATEYLFGDNVKLRSEPNTTSKVLELLPIASPIEIVEKTSESLSFNGFDSPWYKVDYQGKTGYVLGGLIASARQEISEEIYLITISKEGDDMFSKTRFMKADTPYVEVTNKLRTTEFVINAYDSRGLEGVVNMLHINYMAEACGVEGGGIYLFNDGKNLVTAFEYSQISDAGVYWFVEDYFFPADEGGVAAKIVYKKESGRYQDEETNWFEVERTERELEWKGNQIVPNDYLKESE